jgi:GT2 family glycosyltransferase
MSTAGRVTVVIATRDRRMELCTTLGMLAAIPERPPVLVVDNASSDDTAAHVRAHHPDVGLVAARRNMGAGARTLGVEQSATPYVAFSDDDSWWAPGSLDRAVRVLDEHPAVGLVAARVLVGQAEVVDPVSELMRSSPLPAAVALPGPVVLGFLACGAVVRRSAFLAVGGFESRFGIGGEEALLALDLADAGWVLLYLDDVVAHHHPSLVRDTARRWRLQQRNDLWTRWLRFPATLAIGHAARVARQALRDPVTRAALIDACRGLPWVLRERRVVRPALATDLRLLAGRP